MKTAITILAGLLAGVLVAVGILAAFVFVGPDPIGLRPTPAPTLVAPTPAPTGTPLPSPSPSPSVAIGSGGPSPSPAGSASGSADPEAAFHVGQPAPALVVNQLGGGTIDLANLRGKAVWLSFLQTTCPECAVDVPLMNSFSARYADQGLVVIAVDIREDESLVTSFVERLKVAFPVGLDTDGSAQKAWGALTLPAHVWIDTAGVVRNAASGAVGADAMAAGLRTILPGIEVTP